MRISYVISAIIICSVSCAKTEQKAAASYTDLRANTIQAFFNTPLGKKGQANGFWSVNPGEFAGYIEQVYLKDYKPLPSEPSPDRVRKKIKDARYFLRVDHPFCDELFFIDGGDFTASAGKLKELERTRDRVVYSVVFIRRDGTSGKQVNEGAILTVFYDPKKMLLEFTDRKLTFYLETTEPSALAKRYGQRAVSTGLAEY